MGYAVGPAMQPPAKASRTHGPPARKPHLAAPGNQALLRRLQAKLAVGPVDDPLEREADRVADQVMRMADPAPVSSSPALQLQRKCAECEEEQDQQTLQKKSAGGAEPQTAPPIVDEVLRSPGEPLDAATRAFFEPRFGHDFGDVRVHTDAKAAASARMVDAAAYTVGSDLVFAGGRYAPGANDGRSLLAHELAHTIQQGASSRLRHADQNAAATRPPDGTVQRQGEESDTDDASLPADTATSPAPAKTGAAAAKSRPSCSAFSAAYAPRGNQALLRRLQAQRALAPASASARVSRKCAACEEEGKTVQAKRAPERPIALAPDDDLSTSAAPAVDDPAPAPEPSPTQSSADVAQPDAGEADVAQADAAQPESPQTAASPDAAATEAAPDVASPDAAAADAGLPDFAELEAQAEELKVQIADLARYQAPGRTETAGETNCNLETGTPEITIHKDVVAECLWPCVQAHEQSHADFQETQCQILAVAFAIFKHWLNTAKQFAAQNKIAETQRATARAVAAFDETKRAAAQYNRFMDRTCRFDEGTSYGAAIKACDTDDARKRCAAAGQTAEYNKQMAAWRRFMQNPPNCPAAP